MIDATNHNVSGTSAIRRQPFRHPVLRAAFGRAKTDRAL
jgi:hypothetical protein